MKRKTYDPAVRWSMICNAENEGDDSGGGGSDAPKVEDLQKQLDALKSHSSAVLDEKKAEAEKRRNLEKELAEFKAKEKEREEAEAKKRGEFEKLAESEKAEKTALKAKLETTLKANALKDGLSSINIAPQFKRAAEALFKDAVTLDGETATIEGKAPAEFFKAWALTDEGKAYVLNGSSGGGAGGGSGGGNGNGESNPWKPGSISLDEQGKIFRNDPEKAKRLQREAGLKV